MRVAKKRLWRGRRVYVSEGTEGGGIVWGVRVTVGLMRDEGGSEGKGG